MSHILNLGVLAHVDAGKTSLTERILFTTGAIAKLGSVDTGTTHTDTLALEQQRGITIRAAVASAMWSDIQINLVDTPGHPDFIAEVERSLSVLDAVVLVISAVEGVQPQTRRLARAIRAMELPCIIFVNKIDRMGARHDSLLQEITTQLGWDLLPMVTPDDIGTQGARISAVDLVDDEVIEQLAVHDDALLAVWLDGDVSADQILASLRSGLRQCAITPVIFGSAMTGVGAPELLDAVTSLVELSVPHADDLSVQAFKVERNGERVVWLRVHSGTLASRAEFPAGKVTRLQRSTPAGLELVHQAGPGDIVLAHGLAGLRVGEFLGMEQPHGPQQFVPVFETVVREKRSEDRHRLHEALTGLADQDPFISLRHDPRAGVTSVRLFGEVQKEVIEANLLQDYGVQADFADPTIICMERLRDAAEAVERIGVSPNPFAAGMALRISPLPPGSGVRYERMQQSLGRLPLAMYLGIEEAVRATLLEGISGWEVTDILIELTMVEYWDPVTVVGDFRKLAPLILAQALTAAGADVCEPIQRFRLAVPEDLLAEGIRLVMQHRAEIETSTVVGAAAVITGTMPAEMVPSLERRLPGISRGEGDLDHWHDSWRPIAGESPTRSRSQLNPFDRAEYLSRLAGRL